jgi:hypothetical protein
MKLKSNRRFIIYLHLPFLIISSILLLFLIINIIIDYETRSEKLLVLILFIVIECIELSIILLAKYWKGKSYYFNSDEIIVYNKERLQKTIQVSNIEYMHYYPWKFHYFITMFGGSLNEGGAMKIHVKEKDGKKHELGFIGLKDARNLKKVYSDLLTIYYTK